MEEAITQEPLEETDNGVRERVNIEGRWDVQRWLLRVGWCDEKLSQGWGGDARKEWVGGDKAWGTGAKCLCPEE